MSGLSRPLKTFLKNRLHDVFALGQRAGVNVLPNHFYSATPDLKALGDTSGWRAPMEMAGVEGRDTDAQIRFVEETVAGIGIPPDVHAVAAAANGQGSGYGLVEADFLYAFIQKHRPAEVVQVGCGVSTAVILRAAEACGHAIRVTCIEPFPSAYLTGLAAAGKIVLRVEGAQDTPSLLYEAIAPGSLLFVDSTHTVKPGSEVNRIILDAMPRLGPGVWTHFHDIYFPYDFQRTLFTELFFNVESTLLHAFLIGNERWSIAASLSMLHYAEQGRLKAALPRYVPQADDRGLSARLDNHFPSATWLRTRP